MSLAIDEKPLPVTAGRAGKQAPLEAVIGDLGALLRRVAELDLALTEEKRARDKATEKILLQILEAIDGFERVFRAVHAKEDLVTKQMKVWLGNFRTVRRLLDNILAEHQVTPIQNLDAGFDPQWHRVMETVADPSRPDGAIAEELTRGYLRGREILRKSEVVVVKNAE